MKSPFPQDWKEYTIGDCLRRVEHPVEVDSDALYTQIGIRSHGKGLFYKEPVTGESLGSKAVYWVEPDCFILNIVFAWEQAIGKTTQAEVGMIGSHRFPMYKPVNNLIDIDYLISYLLTKRGTDILEAASPGGAGRNRTLGQDRFMKSRIVLPPLDEQQKIAEILSTQDKAIELQGRKIEELKRFKKGCLEKMFPRKAQKVPEKRFPGFTDDWEQHKFSELVQIERGGSPRPIDDFITDAPNGLNWIKIGDAPTQGNYITKTAEKIRPEGLSKTREVHPGDLILSNSMSFGKPYIMGIDGCIHDGWLLIRNAYGVFDLTFLCHLLGTPQMLSQYRSLAAGSTVNNLNKELVGNTVVTIPSITEQRVLGDYLEQLDNLITLHQRKLEEMKKQKKALMQLLLTGIVRVQS